jgi:hypothetical protein
MTKIIDIGEESDVEVRVPYQQYVAWCNLHLARYLRAADKPWGTSGFKHERGFTNGSIALRVQTTLSAPVASSTIQVLVFVRGAENLDFSSPTSVGLETLTAAEIQGGDDVEIQAGEDENKGETGTMVVASGAISRPIDHLYLTYMGERVGSLRVLLRRYCKIMTFAPQPPAYNDYIIQTLTLGRLPPPPGWDTNALSDAKGIIDTGTTRKFNFSHGNFLNYITPAYVGNRGSVNWSANIDIGSTAPQKHFTVIRDKAISAVTSTQATWSMTSTAYNTRKFLYFSRTSGAGALVVNSLVSGAANWQMPYYSSLKFSPTDNAQQNSNVNRNLTTPGDMWTAEWTESGSYGATPNAAKLHLYAGAGTDFDLLYFHHVPTYGVMTGIPDAA